MEEGEREGEAYEFSSTRAPDDWPRSLSHLTHALLSSSTTSRVHFLRHDLLPLAQTGDLSLSQTLDLFRALTLTYPRYADSASRTAVEDVGTELVKRDAARGDKLGIAEQIAGWVGSEAKRVAGKPSGHASGSILVLLSWAAGLYTVVLHADGAWSHTAATLLGALAVLLDAVLGEGKKTRGAVRKAAEARARRALRSAPAQLNDALDALLAASKGSLGLSALPLLCIAISDSPSTLSSDRKGALLSIYTTSVLGARTPVPPHILDALKAFVATLGSEELESVLGAADKSLLRSPEVALDVLASFIPSYPLPLPSPSFARLLAPTLASTKSANTLVRTSSIRLFTVLVAPPTNAQAQAKVAESDRAKAASDLLALLGAKAGPDKPTLYAMLSSLVPSPSLSHTIISQGVSILSKDPSDALARGLAPHLAFVLSQDDIKDVKESAKVIEKEIGSTKPATRKAFAGLVAEAFWTVHTPSTPAAQALAKSVLPAFENTLKSASAVKTSTDTSGQLEGLLAAATLLGPLSRSESTSEAVSKNPILSALGGTSGKPSFLLTEKSISRSVIAGGEDALWLTRALEGAGVRLNGELEGKGGEGLRRQIGGGLLSLCVDCREPGVRKEALGAVERLVRLFPGTFAAVVRDALLAYATRPAAPSSKVKAAAEDGEGKDKTPPFARLLLFLSTVSSIRDVVPDDERETILVPFVVIAHYPSIAGSSRQGWIDLCVRARVDPAKIVRGHLGDLFAEIDSAFGEGSTGMEKAALVAQSVLAFVEPGIVLEKAKERVGGILDEGGKEVRALSSDEMGMWGVGEGEVFVDVLAAKKPAAAATAKGKGAELDKWDAEVRKSLASKKAAGTKLSKADQAAVDAQVKKEAAVRARVNTLAHRLLVALRTLRALVDARIDGLQSHAPELAALILTGGVLSENGRTLVGDEALEAYLALGAVCASRLGPFARFTGLAALRTQGATVPAELAEEPLGALVTRVLYRLRATAEQAPLDAAAFGYVWPLLGEVMLRGGVGVKEGEGDGEEGEEGSPFEQIALALDVVKFNVGEFGDPAFPRVHIITAVLHAMRTQLRLSKDASSALVALGETIASSPSPTRLEADALLQGTLVQETPVRTACLQALAPLDLTEREWDEKLLVACSDEDDNNARLARGIWDDNGLDVPADYAPALLALLEHEIAYVRNGAALALAEAVEHWPNSVSDTVGRIKEMYVERAQVIKPEFDQYGMLVEGSLERSDPWAARAALAGALVALAPLLADGDVVPLFQFLIDEPAALGDRHADVRRAMLEGGTAAVDAHGSEHLPELIAMFEGHLARSHPRSESADYVQEAVVVLVGRVARHLKEGDKRLPSIVDRLVDALKTPSEQVQVAVGDCLAPLVRTTRGDAPKLVQKLLDELFNAPKYAARRGAAYGLAGVMKGVGIAGMKEFNILEKLKEASEDKKRYEPRQGAMFALETLCTTLGRVAEPHAIEALPLLLQAFGDGIPDVREAAQDAARALMRNMSGYGVKLVLPDLLAGLDEKQWRTKKGSIELLGMMAYCAPRQLSQSLPVIIPQLTGVITDSHAQVRQAGNRSLKQFGEVIANPEIQALVPIFLKAMVDPGKTPNALSALLKTSFVHYIDHSSLALVIPILERGLKERGADSKRKAAQIVGNLASLTDAKDFVPYLSTLMPMVHSVLVDPVPEARATAAKTLGTLVERLGEAAFPDLVPGLLRTLKADTSGVDRQGAAQGLSEVLAGLGMERLEGLLPDVIASAQAPRASVREGFMSLLVFLPATFGARFTPHLPKIIVPILKGLADTEEYVREAAMKAGRMVIANYATKAIDLLLPELERGMFDPGWRIRQSSITLVGELLFKVSGISGKNEVDDDEEGAGADAVVAESSRRALTEVLGEARRDRILAALYLARQDSVHAVRTSSIHIWKALVSNTPRTVREILPTLSEHIMELLCSLDEEQEDTAARTTTELCRKFGERIVGETVAIMRAKSSSPDARTREGVVRMLCEVMAAATDTQWEGAEDEIIAMVRAALVDDEARVRAAAARAFDLLQEKLGAKAIDATIPTLLEALRQPGAGSGTALQALKEVMGVRANTVFPVLIPTLTALPMSAFNANALATLVAVAGSALSKRLNVILGSLAKMTEQLRKSPDEELQEAIDEAVRALLECVDDAEGLNTLMLLLLGWIKHEDPERRVTAADYFALFCEVSELDTSLYRVDWIRVLIPAMDDSIVAVHTAIWRAFDAFAKSVPKDELEPLVVPLRRAIESTGSPHAPVPGFSLPKGVAPFVPIIIAGLTTGSNEQREQAAYAIGDLVERTEETAIKPFVVPFTGPLIRVATQATTYPPAVKTGILSALTTMLERIPAFVKPFYPQLQRTFIKSASDPASVVVRSKAAAALGVLMRSQPRVDPVVTELATGARQNDDSISSSLVQALAYVVRSAGANVGPAARETALELVSEAFRTQNDETYSQSIGMLFAALTTYGELVQPIIDSNLVPGSEVNTLSTHCILAVLTAYEEDDANDKALPPVFAASLPTLAKKINENLTSDRVNITRPSREAKEILRRIDASLI
ncbi:ARM repeat-containing protein [Peniophora sp. CONT]|nr:ARM repeat-containing protein [Peniophora sp. CONT]